LGDARSLYTPLSLAPGIVIILAYQSRWLSISSLGHIPGLHRDWRNEPKAVFAGCGSASFAFQVQPLLLAIQYISA
jgi:hypothetical protein